MVWLFDRDQETILLHTFLDTETKEFVALITSSADGEEQRRFDSLDGVRQGDAAVRRDAVDIEWERQHVRFESAETFRRWLQALEARLEREQWTAAAIRCRYQPAGLIGSSAEREALIASVFEI